MSGSPTGEAPAKNIKKVIIINKYSSNLALKRLSMKMILLEVVSCVM